MELEEQMEKNIEEKKEEREEATEESFLKELYFFMKQRDTPIERIPHLGFKQIDLYLMYKTVKELGGYHQVTAQQLWKKVYNILGGNPRSTSAATCTRRHYEKLLLPYEYHLAGYTDNIPITIPRKHKLPLCYDDQYLLNPKRPVMRHAPPFNQPVLSDRVHIMSMPGSVLQYLHPGPPSLPNIFPLPPSMPSIPSISSPFHSRTPMSYSPPSSLETKPLDFLRHLSEEYKSLSGLAEPLNLSNKKGRLEISSSTPSSFSPPSSTKGPKFLNEALPLYTSRGDQSKTPAGSPRVDTPTQAVVNPMNMDVVNLTSSSGSSPTLKKATSSSLLMQRPSYPSAFSVKKPEQSLQVLSAKEGSSDMARSSTSQASSRPSLDPYGGMEIQIPLSLLQNWIKDGLISSLASSCSAPPQESKKNLAPESFSQTRTSSEASEGLVSSLATSYQQLPGPLPPQANKSPLSHNSLGRGRISSSESSDIPSNDFPADLSLKNHLRDLVNANRCNSGFTASPVTANERELPSINRYASVKPFLMTTSAKMSFSRDPYHSGSHINTSPAEEQNGYHKQANSSSIRNQDNTGPRSPGYNADFTSTLAAKSLKTSEKAPMVKLNSTSSPLIQITPEHLKFLLSNSQFRLEKGKIC